MINYVSADTGFLEWKLCQWNNFDKYGYTSYVNPLRTDNMATKQHRTNTYAYLIEQTAR